METGMDETFDTLALQPPAATWTRRLYRGLPAIALPWLEIGLALAALVMLRLA